MHLTIDREALLHALAAVSGAVQKRMTIPILTHVKITAADGRLRTTATDLDLEATSEAPAEIEATGAITAHADTLHTFVRKLPAKAILTLKAEDGQFLVAAGRARLALPTLPVEDFPVMPPAGDTAASFTIETAALRALIDRTRFAISTEATRYYLNGLFLHLKDGADKTLCATATDGHRLAYAETEISPDGEWPAIIVPRATINEARKLIAEYDGTVVIAATPAKITISAGAASIQSKLIDGSFPDYQRIVPAASKHRVTISRTALAEALGRVLVAAGDKAYSVRCAIAGAVLTLRTRSDDRGEAIEDIDCETEGAPPEIGFNGRYLIDALGQSDGEDIAVGLNDSGSPALIKDEAAPACFSVLMPLRV